MLSNLFGKSKLAILGMSLGASLLILGFESTSRNQNIDSILLWNSALLVLAGIYIGIGATFLTKNDYLKLTSVILFTSLFAGYLIWWV